MAEAFIPAAASRRTALYRCRDVDGDRHRHAVWRGRTALLILQRCAAGVRFGTELTSWLHRWPESEPPPAFTSPSNDWLTRTEHSDAAWGRSFRSKTDEVTNDTAPPSKSSHILAENCASLHRVRARTVQQRFR